MLTYNGKPAVVERRLLNNGILPLMLTLIALSAALMQQAPAPPAPPQVHSRVMVMGGGGHGGLDKDGDGQISREEFAAPMDAHFARMDSNGDGRLSTEEMTTGHGAMGEGGNHDVRIMRGPGGPGMHRGHAASAGAAHAEHGADGNREVRIMRGAPGAHGAHGESGAGRTMVFTSGEPGARIEREIVVHGGPDGHPAMGHGAQAEGGPGQRIEIRRMGGPGSPGGHDGLDTDGDGKISEAEFSAPLREAFARMDADSSGFIEAGEHGAGHDAAVFVHRIEMRSGGED